MQVEMEGDALQRTAEAVAATPEAMLGLEPAPVVGTEGTGLGQQMTDQPLETEEGETFWVLMGKDFATLRAPVLTGPLISNFKSQVMLYVCERESFVHI